MTSHRPSHLVPKLRFPEFQRAGDWKREHIGNVASITKGKGVSKADITKGGATPCIRYAELYTHYHEVIHQVVSRTNVPHEDLMLSQAEDVIIPASGETRADIARAACVLPERVALGSDLNILRSDLYGPFFSYLLNSPLRHTIARMAQGDTVAHLYPKELSQVWLAYPLRLEQQKIVDCLGSLDGLIAAEGRKLEALRQHKQGLMQQLFPQPGETVPRLRFREFRDEARWDLLPLSSASDLNPSNDGLPELFIYIDLESVKSSMLVGRKEVTRDTAPSRAQRLLSRKDIIFQTVRPYQRNNLFFDIDDGFEYVASTGYAQLRAHECPEFLYQLLHTDSFVNSVSARCTGSNYPAINSSDLGPIDVALPRRPEQQKIADCLTSIDDQLNAQARKLDKLKHHKQGLLQQLFPSLDGQ